MPYTFRYTQFLNGPQHGSSETWYFQQESGSVQSAINAVNQVPGKRAALLGGDWTLTGYRVEVAYDDTGTPVLRQGQVNLVNLPGVASQPSSESNISLLVQAYTFDLAYRKACYLAGSWASLFPSANTVANPLPGTWNTRWNSYVSALQQTPAFGWMADVRGEADEVNIVDYTFDPVSGITTYTLQEPFESEQPLQKPIRVGVEFPLVRSPLDGVQLVIFTSQTECYTAKPRPAPVYTVAGKMTIQTLGFQSLVAGGVPAQPGPVLYQKPVSRKRGRPTLASRGRKAVQVRW